LVIDERKSLDLLQSVAPRSFLATTRTPSVSKESTIMLRVTPVYGSPNNDNKNNNHGAASTPSCTLVEYGGCRVLVNVGWDDSMLSSTVRADALPQHDVLLITDSTLGAMGGLPLYHQQCPNTPVYATFPTVKMGQMTLYDQHASLSFDGTTPPYTLDDIDSCCAALRTIKYSQNVFVPNTTITTTSTTNTTQQQQPTLRITAQRAGHVVGAAFFIIQRLQDETSIVVTSTYQIGKELHLDSSTLVKYGVTPDVLITQPGGPAMTYLSRLYGSNTKKKKPLLPTPVASQAERTLIETVLAVLRREGNVLLPVDASGRVLEVLLLLSQQWDRQRLAGAYNLCWVGPMTQNTIDFARSQLEWMAAPLGAQFDSQRGHPFQLNNVSICSSMSELESVLDNGNPSCVLASGASLDHGFARDLLLKFADNPDNAVVFTDSSRCVLRGVIPTDKTAVESAEPSLATTEEEGEASLIGSAIPQDQSVSEYSTAAQLLMHWGRAKLEGEEMEDVVEVDILLPHRSPLSGPELKAFLAQEEATRQAQKAAEERRALLREVEIAKGQLRLGEEEAMSGGADTGGSSAGVPRAQPKHMSTRPKKKSRFDSSLFLKFSKPLHCKCVFLVMRGVGVYFDCQAHPDLQLSRFIRNHIYSDI
jgi:cleavage and polyadenylation specificity factor subunit 2